MGFVYFLPVLRNQLHIFQFFIIPNNCMASDDPKSTGDKWQLAKMFSSSKFSGLEDSRAVGVVGLFFVPVTSACKKGIQTTAPESEVLRPPSKSTCFGVKKPLPYNRHVTFQRENEIRMKI